MKKGGLEKNWNMKILEFSKTLCKCVFSGKNHDQKFSRNIHNQNFFRKIHDQKISRKIYDQKFSEKIMPKNFLEKNHDQTFSRKNHDLSKFFPSFVIPSFFHFTPKLTGGGKGKCFRFARFLKNKIETQQLLF